MPSREFVYIKKENKKYAHQAQFLINVEWWDELVKLCKANDNTASEVLREFVDDFIVAPSDVDLTPNFKQGSRLNLKQKQFAVNDLRWYSFTEKCKSVGLTASVVLNLYVYNYIRESLNSDCNLSITLKDNDLTKFIDYCNKKNLDVNDVLVNFIKSYK